MSPAGRGRVAGFGAPAGQPMVARMFLAAADQAGVSRPGGAGFPQDTRRSTVSGGRGEAGLRDARAAVPFHHPAKRGLRLGHQGTFAWPRTSGHQRAAASASRSPSSASSLLALPDVVGEFISL
jgi:hypothetical protein